MNTKVIRVGCVHCLIDSKGVTVSSVLVASLTLCNRFLGAFAKLRKATINIRHVCLSVCRSIRMQLGSHWTDLRKILYLCIFRKCVEKIQV
jgi:hypothetical protein